MSTKLQAMRVLAESGIAPDPVEYDILKRAFRLQHFGRCPRCDSYVTVFNDPIGFSQEMACPCGWKFSMEHILMIRSSPEAIAEWIVREALA